MLAASHFFVVSTVFILCGSFAKMPGESGAEIFYIGKAALPRYLFYTIVAGAQKIHCMVKA